MQATDLRKLNSQAEEMLGRARQLYAQASVATGSEKDALRQQADEWVKKANELAQIVSRLTKAS
ncbi:hypothetical protein BH10PSE9_BH10PSE9_04840 [soil metagenome]